ncbi:MAG: NAD(P)-dependent oxidoreductase [Bacteroidetes bacterium]|nr:NAD(P)-dependent oxidoreductase [Bacteroidota bacterium]
MKKKLIITGASGFLGYHLLRAAAQQYEVYALYNQKPLHYAQATPLHCDITNYIQLGNYFEDIEPDAVIHAAAMADANYCQQHKAESYAANVDASKNIAGLCSDYKIPLVYTSTDLVFDGKQGMYTEADGKNPLSIYGEHKSIAEDEVLHIYPNATVARLPMMFGYADASDANYLQKFIAQIKRGETVSLFNDEYRSVGGAASIAKGIVHVLGRVEGVVHIAGKERLSRYQFGAKAAKAFGLNEAYLSSCSQKDVSMAAPRPADVSLNIEKALALGYNPLNVDDELNLVAQSSFYE